MYSNFDLGVVIPVRLGSSRIVRKVMLPMGDENVSLLAWKIRQLKLIMDPDRIYVSTEADELKEIAIEEGVKVLHRDPSLADGHKVSFSEVILGVVKDVPHEHVAWVTAVVPLMSPQEYLGAFEAYKNQVVGTSAVCDSLVAVNLMREYLWDDDKPINYKASREHTVSQDLPNIYRVTNGVYMCPKSLALDCGYFLGPRPYKYVVSKIAGIDIDEYEDYLIAESLFKMYKVTA